MFVSIAGRPTTDVPEEGGGPLGFTGCAGGPSAWHVSKRYYVVALHLVTSAAFESILLSSLTSEYIHS